MRLKSYIINEGRGKKISEDRVFSELIGKYTKALTEHEKNGKVLSRHIQEDPEYYLIDPKVGKPRVSRNTKNYYTLVMDNSKRWSRYPDRSKSIICYSNRSMINPMASHVVLVEDNANIGVCPDQDLWWSFQDILPNRRLLDDLNIFIYAYFNNIKANTDDKNLSIFKKSCKKADEHIKKNGIYDNEELKSALTYLGYNSEKWFDKNYKGNFYQFLDNILDPKRNGFNTININGDWYPDVEAWTDSKSLMIRIDIFRNFKDVCKQRGII